MPAPSDIQPSANQAGPAGSEAVATKPSQRDLSGRDRLVRNVLSSWGTHFVYIVAGFVMPRMIDTKLGQEVLGIWDFAWSLVAYFQWIEAGIAGSVNRYVGRYWATQDVAGINRVVSSATFVLCLASSAMLVLTAAVSMLLPKLFGHQLGENAASAQWTVCFLGTSLSIQILIGAFNGVVTGCHRWELLNLIRSGWYLATVVGMFSVLMLGGGLVHMAIVTLVGEACAQFTRLVAAFRVCPGLRLQKSLVRGATIKELYVFGGKNMVIGVCNLLLNSTASVLIVSHLGPAALALYARPRNLIHQAGGLVRRMTMTLIPTTSALEGAGDMSGVRDLLLKAVRYALYLTLPIVTVLTIFGGPVLQLWMGPQYANSLLVMVVALGALAQMAQAPVVDILVGLNTHGRAAVGESVASALSIFLLYIALGPAGLGITGAAVAIAVPLTLLNCVYYPWVICRRVGLGVWDYVRSVTVAPLLHVLPFVLCLAGARYAFREAPLRGLVLSGLVGGAMLAVIYWRHVLPSRMKLGLGRLWEKGVRLTVSGFAKNEQV